MTDNDRTQVMDIYIAIDGFNDTQKRRVDEITGNDTAHARTDYREDNVVDKAFLNCEVVFGNVPAHWLNETSVLRWAQLDSVGFGEYRSLDWAVLGKSITLTNLAGFFSDPVAQSALAGILSLYRGVDQLVLAKAAGEWRGDPLREQLRTLTNAHVVLFGFGGINQRLAELLSAFDCRITHFGRQWTDGELNAALADADIVVCTVPETDATIGLFDQARLALLKPDALFVNFGRGSVVDEAALAAALRNRTIGGAVIDVTLDEPLAVEHAFWQLPNLILTQHSGGGTMDELDRKIDVFADNLTRYRESQPLVGVVDFIKGY